jgi:hypothetical protein
MKNIKSHKETKNILKEAIKKIKHLDYNLGSELEKNLILNDKDETITYTGKNFDLKRFI